MCPAKTTNFVFAIFYVLVHCITSVSSYALPIQSHIITALKKFDVTSLYILIRLFTVWTDNVWIFFFQLFILCSNQVTVSDTENYRDDLLVRWNSFHAQAYN